MQPLIKEPEWFTGLSKEQKKTYFEKHPNSKYNPNRKQKEEETKQVIERKQNKVTPIKPKTKRVVKNPERLANFKRWSGGAKVIHAIKNTDYKFQPNEPVVVKVLHGTLNDFDSFTDDKANKESDAGVGFYFSNSVSDVMQNYASVNGADFESKLYYKTERLKERDYFVDEDPPKPLNKSDLEEDQREGTYYSLTEKQAKLVAEYELGVRHNGLVIPSYVKFNKPVILSEDGNGTVLYMETTADRDDYDNSDDYDDEKYLIDNMAGPAKDFIEVFGRECWNHDAGELFEKFMQIDSIAEGELDITEVNQRLRSTDFFQEHSDNEAVLTVGYLINETLRKLGFDGIIDETVGYKFRHMRGVEEDTKHFISFNNKNIKSAIGNTTFSDSEKITAKLTKKRHK